MSRAGSVPPLHGVFAFEAIARHRSLILAAMERAQSCSALRRALRALESHVGATLLMGGSASCTLTPAGLAYLPIAHRFVRCLTDALPPRPAADSTLRIQANVDAAQAWLLPCLAEELPGHAAIELRIDGAAATRCAQPAHLTIAADAATEQDAAVVGATWTEQLVLVGPRGGEDAHDATQRDGDGRLRLIVHRDLDLEGWFRAAALPPPPRVRLRVDDMRSVAAAVRAGLGPGVLCERVAQAGLAAGEMLQWAHARHPGRRFRVLLAPQAMRRADVRALLERLRASALALPRPVPARWVCRRIPTQDIATAS